MTIATVTVCDAIRANISHLPHGPAAGYTTGSGIVPWGAAEWKAHPGAVRICQDSGSDHTADVLDVERGAATNGQAAGWFKAALSNYHAAKRPGQRSPAIYTSASNVTPLVNALIAAGVTSGVGLWVANWNLSLPQAYADVVNAAGPFPIVGVQWSSGQYYDTNVFSGGWLARVSQVPPVTGAPYVHYTDGVTRLGDYAGSRNMTVPSFLAEQARQYAAQTAALAALGQAVPPKGIQWFTNSP